MVRPIFLQMRSITRSQILSGLLCFGMILFHFSMNQGYDTPKIAVLSLLSLWHVRQKLLPPRMTAVLCAGLSCWVWSLILARWHGPNFLEIFSTIGLFPLIALAYLGSSPAFKVQLQRALAWAGIAHCSYLFFQFLGLDFYTFPEDYQRGGFFGNPNQAAAFLILSLSLGSWPNRAKPYFYGLFFLGILITTSRIALLTLFIMIFLELKNALIFKPYFQKIKPLSLLKYGLFFVFIFLFLCFLYFRKDCNSFYHYLKHPQEYANSYMLAPRDAALRAPWFQAKRASLMARYALYSNSLAMILAEPMGYGLGQFRSNYPRFANHLIPDPFVNEVYRERAVHNWLLELLLTTGWLGFLLSLWLLSKLWKGSDQPTKTALALQAFMALFILNYLNPVILFALSAMLAPSEPLTSAPRPNPSSKTNRLILTCKTLFSWLTLAALIFAIGLSCCFQLAKGYFRNSWAEAAKPIPIQLAWIWPEFAAEQAFYNHDFERSWKFAVIAWKSDPYGPETLLHLGNIAAELKKNPTAVRDWPAIELAAYGCAHRRFPYHRDAQMQYLSCKSQWEKDLKRPFDEASACQLLRSQLAHEP